MGSASLFSTEKFESYNGVLRQFSVHSNRLSPGRDVAVTFDNYSTLKFLLSGGVIYNEQTGCTSTASRNVQEAFNAHPQLQQSLGCDSRTATEFNSYPLDLNARLPKADKQAIPVQFTDVSTHVAVHQVAQLKLSKHDLIQKGVYVVVNQAPKYLVGLVESLWVKNSSARCDYYALVNGFEAGDVDPHYQMRKIRRTAHHALYLMGSINVQHNCCSFNCPVVKSWRARIEQQETSTCTPEVQHKDDDHFIIKSASLSNAELHRLVAALPMEATTPQEWTECVRAGYAVWTKTGDTFDEDNLSDPEDTNDTPDDALYHAPDETP
ncbi:hypothetical protein PCASD_06316 [Puccinia coronata f. sp. avenae]|uniref:Uncharacterized protein n=1 Tax=Puccinia coronata f. sp. avenae TaxID=200324 RepID=A0A2N5V922_9BASI|nr:hypothetical protein PCASD_06316 [Puccinia coronata f. sp. avenae]